MKDSIFYYRIGTQRECECPGGACNTSSSLQQRSSKGIGLGELPKCSTFFCRSTGTRMDKHMKFPQDIMRQYCRHQVKMISVQPSNGDIIHIALRLQLAARVFLRPSAIMKVENLLHGGLVVRVVSTILCKFGKGANGDAPFRPSLFASQVPSSVI